MMDSSIEQKCRLCGQERAIPKDRRHPIKKEAHRNDILKIFEIDVSADHAGCPPYVCHPCCQRMRKVFRIRQGKQRGQGTAWDVTNWPVPSSVTVTTTATSSMNDDQDDTSEMTFREAVRGSCTKYGIIDVSGDKSLTFVTLETGTGNWLFKLEIGEHGTWRLWYKSLLIRNSVPILDKLPAKLESVECVETLLTIIKTGSVCAGHNDFPLLAGECSQEGKNILTGQTKNEMVGFYHHGTFRSRNCHVIVQKCEGPQSLNMCSSCMQPEFRQSLRSRESYLRTRDLQKDERKVQANSKTPFSHLSPEEKNFRLKNLSKVAHSLKHKVQRLKTKLDKMLNDAAVALSPEQNALMSKLSRDNHSHVAKVWSEDSPQRLLWEQQVKRNSVKGPGGMRWHPTIIRWCLSMYMKSPAAYRQLAGSGFLNLPSKSTLKTYSNFTESLPGVNPEILQILVKEFNLPAAPAFQRNVSLVWDEMKVRSGLVISKGSGRVIGFTSLDSVSMELGMLSHLGSPKETEPELATHILVFMVRGLLVHVNMPFIWYPCQGFNAQQLWGAVWGATRALHNLGLSVRAWVCDGATPNRKFYRVHEEEEGGQYQGITYCTENRYAPGEKIYFICDVPHLLKTTRNNLENSHGHLNSKNLTKNGLSISWAHIVSTVDEDMSHGLNRLPKIKEEHIHLSPQLRMRVKLATQVLSATMGNALGQRHRPEMLGTAAFCQLFNKWFDCLNGRYLKAPKPDLRPYMANEPNDPRYLWLEDVFLGWLNEWEIEIEALHDLSKAEKNKFLLSYQTSQGLKITTKSFLDLARTLLAEEGAQFLIPEKLNQDRLEVFFAKLRRACGDSDNPTVDEARHRIVSLIVAGRQVMAPRNANCAVDEGAERDIFMPQRKRKRN